YTAPRPTRRYTSRLHTFVSPKSRPKIQATRSNLATATRPQLSPPTSTSVSGSRSRLPTIRPPPVENLFNSGRQRTARIASCQTHVHLLYSWADERRDRAP